MPMYHVTDWRRNLSNIAQNMREYEFSLTRILSHKDRIVDSAKRYSEENRISGLLSFANLVQSLLYIPFGF